MDIVERLRICAKYDPDQAEAADEIERLRGQSRMNWDAFQKAATEIERLREALRLAGDRVEPLASFQQKDIGSSTIRVGEETKFSRDARNFNGEK